LVLRPLGEYTGAGKAALARHSPSLGKRPAAGTNQRTIGCRLERDEGLEQPETRYAESHWPAK
jgi:hypothetical protein